MMMLNWGLLVTVGGRWSRSAARLSVAALVLVALLAALLVLRASSGTVDVYLVGNWAAPFGIAIALDRLSAMMVALTATAALVCALYARGGEDRRGPYFHALLQFQVMGLNGAFLTADLFNLFVFFELLLIASYGLLVHGAGRQRLRAAMHYVTFNLVASAMFLIAIAILYSVTGTLNLADLAVRIPALEGGNATLAHSALALLLVVFGVKAAMLPLYFWLPDTYSAVTAPVAALFAVLTKVGVYSVLRVVTLMGESTVVAAVPWLPVLAGATLVLAAAGALAATRLRTLVAYLVVASAGTLMLGVGLGTRATVGAVLFYLVHSTAVTMALFLIVEQVNFRRADGSDVLRPRPWRQAHLMLGGLFALLACAAAGLPPFAGFLGKALLMDAVIELPSGALVWTVVLLSALAIIVALARAGAVLFWAGAAVEQRLPSAAGSTTDGAQSKLQPAALGFAVAVTLCCAVFAGSLASYADAAAAQLFASGDYIRAVLEQEPVATQWNLRALFEEARP